MLPIQRAGKAPLTRHGLHDASTDPDVLRRWWARWPGANVAIATGAPGPDVLDVDVRGDQSGWAALRHLREAGIVPPGVPLAVTPSFINGRFGLLFAVCDESCWAVVR
jgi:hypothetical protein